MLYFHLGTVSAVFSVTSSFASSCCVVLISGAPVWWLDAASRLSSSRLAERASVSLKSRVSIWITCNKQILISALEFDRWSNCWGGTDSFGG